MRTELECEAEEVEGRHFPRVAVQGVPHVAPIVEFEQQRVVRRVGAGCPQHSNVRVADLPAPHCQPLSQRA